MRSRHKGTAGFGWLALCITLVTSIPLFAAPEVVPNFPNTQQNTGELLSGLNAPEQGRTAVIAYHGGILFTIPEMPASEPNSDFQVRSWDIANPRAPQELAQHGLTPHPVDAHGYFKSGENLVLGSDYADVGPWNFVATGSNNTVIRAPFAANWWGGYASRGNIFGPRGVGPIFWSYNAIQPENMILTDSLNRAPYADVTASWDHLGMTGVLGFPIIFGNRLIVASDQSQTGIATYDISDRNNPVLLDVLKTGGPGGYFPELWGEDGELYVVFPHRTEPRGHGFQVADISDMTNLRHVGDYALEGDEPMYVQFQDNYAFMGSHKVDMRTHQSVLNFNNMDIARPDGGRGISMSQFALPLGNLLITGGVNQNQGMAIWAHQSEPDNRPPTVGYHIPQAAQTNYPVDAVLSFLIHETLETFTIINGDSFSVRPIREDGSLGDFITGELVFSYNDILTFTPHTALTENTSYQVTFAENGIKDAAGNGMQQYQFSFSTGSGVSGNTPPHMESVTASSNLLNLNQSVTLTAIASDSAEDSLEYRFDFGDGSNRTQWQAANSSDHSFAAPGHYRVLAQVRDQDGLISSQSTVVTVTDYRPASAPQLHSAPLYLDSDEQRLWTVNSDNDSISVINSETYELLNEINACNEPFALTQDNQQRIWVSCKSDDQILLLDSSGQVLQHIPLDYGSAPAGIVRNLSGEQVYIALEGKQQILRFDTGTTAQTHSQQLGRSPRALAINRTGDVLLVTQFISNLNEGSVWSLNPETLELETTISINKIGGVHHRDTTADGKGVPNYLSSIMIAPDGQHAWLTAIKANTDRGLLTGVDLDQDNTVRTVIIELDLNNNAVIRSIDLDNSDSASHLSYSPLQDYLFITLQGNNKVMVLDTLSQANDIGLGMLVASIPTGGAPQGIVIDPSNQQAWVKNLTGRSISRLDLAAFFATGSVAINSTEINTVLNESMSTEILRGKSLFYHASDERMSGEGYISCASCHNGGDSDGRVWDFTGRGEGLRNTTSLLGKGGTAQGNVHWTGNFDEIHDFENDIRLFFGGTGFLSDSDFTITRETLGTPKQGLNADLDALAAYVTSLGTESLKRSPHRTAEGELTTQGIAGEVVFQSMNCVSCHSGPQFTDSELGVANLHDVGTISDRSGNRMGNALTGLDTPTLLGVWDNAPYLHDGSARELADVFVKAGGQAYPAELGTVSGMGWTVSQWTELNNDSSVRDGGYVSLITRDDSLTIVDIEGGDGGPGQLSLRHSNNFDANINIRINGFSQDITLPAVSVHGVAWETVIIDEIPLIAGNSNQLTLTVLQEWRGVDIDEAVISTPEQISAAQPHRQVLSLPQQSQQALISYILQLDGHSTNDDSGNNLPPVASIAGPTSASAGATVRLSGDPSEDPDGNIVSYAWHQTSGTAAVITDASIRSTDVLLPDVVEDEMLVFSLTITDNSNAAASVSHSILVAAEPENQAPVAVITGPDSAQSGTNILLSGSLSSDPDNDMLSYQWQQTAGSSAILTDIDNEALQLTLPGVSSDEILTFRLTVTDQHGLSASTDFSITLTAPEVTGNVPEVVFTGNTEATAGDWVTLDARESYDIDGDELFFEWQQISGASVEIPWPKSGLQQFQIPVDAHSQNLLFGVTVTDSSGLSATAEYSLTVYANAAPVAVVSGPDSATSGRYVEISAEDSYDINGHNIHYNWEQISGTAVDIAWPNSSKLGFHTPVVYEDEILIFRITVSDDLGAASHHEQQLTLRKSREPVIVAPSSLSARAGEYIELDASQSHDPDGDTLMFRWQQIAGPAVDIPWPEAPKIGFHAPYLESDSQLIFKLTVTDTVGVESRQEIILDVAANQAPVLDADIPAAMESGQSTYLNAWASHDPEGSPLSYQWQFVSGPWVEFLEPESGGFTFTAPAVKETQDLVIKLTLTDAQGAKTQQEFTISIVANLPPEIVSQTWVTAEAGAFVQLHAGDSFDPEGENIWFYWQQVSGESPAAIWGEWTEQLNIQLSEQQKGELLFQVTVTDESGHASEKEIHLVVQ